MTHDERISAYIDNELSRDQEQEFLISLAANEGLRKSFRSELILKNVLHRDEAATIPPRRLRGAVFTALGLGVSASIATSKANASSLAHTASRVATRGFVKSLFATKLTTLATVATLTASAVVGYGVRTVVAPSSVTPAVVEAPIVRNVGTALPPTLPTLAQPSRASTETNLAPAAVSPAAVSPAAKHAVKKSTNASHPVPPAPSAADQQAMPTTGGGAIRMEPPKVTH